MHSKSVYAEVEYLTFFTLLCYLVADVYASDSLTVCNPVTLSVELENIKPPSEDAQPLKGKGVEIPRPNSISFQETPSSIMASARIPRNELGSCSQSAKTEKR